MFVSQPRPQGLLLNDFQNFVLAFLKYHVIKISKIFGDFVPRDSSLCQGLLPSIRHFENRRGEGPGDEVGLCPSEGHKHGVPIQSSINLGDALLQIIRD